MTNIFKKINSLENWIGINLWVIRENALGDVQNYVSRIIYLYNLDPMHNS